MDIDYKYLVISEWSSKPQSGFSPQTPRGIKVTHTPTGLSAECDNERSQCLNRDNAVRLIEDKLQALEEPQTGEEMLHWYAISYLWSVPNRGKSWGSRYIGISENKVTSSTIAENKRGTGVPEDALVMAVSYLGHMTEEEFDG